jgi:hypothetical protein
MIQLFSQLPPEDRKFFQERFNERWEQLYHLEKDYGLDAIKHLFLTNSGGAVATLAFIGTQKTQVTAGAIASLLLFGFGIILVGFHKAIIYHGISGIFKEYKQDVNNCFIDKLDILNVFKKDEERVHKFDIGKWGKLAIFIPYFSFGCFIAGSTIGISSLSQKPELAASSDLSIFKTPEFARVSGFAPDSATDWLQVVIQGLTLIGLFVSGYFAYRAFKAAQKQSEVMEGQLRIQQKQHEAEQEARFHASKPIFVWNENDNVNLTTQTITLAFANKGAAIWLEEAMCENAKSVELFFPGFLEQDSGATLSFNNLPVDEFMGKISFYFSLKYKHVVTGQAALATFQATKKPGSPGTPCLVKMIDQKLIS